MFYGIDAHKRFLQVCAVDSRGDVLSQFRVGGDASEVSTFAATLTDDDQVALEATFHSYALWTILRRHAGRVVVVNAMQVKAIAHARVKTDKVDAHILAQLLRADFLPEVTMCDEDTWRLRRLVAHRRFVGKQRVAARNAIPAQINDKLLSCPYDSAFTHAGRRWLQAQDFSPSERETLDSFLVIHDGLDQQLTKIDARLCRIAADREDAKILMTIPGIGIVVAVGLLSAIGDVHRFPTPQRLASYFGLVPRVHQSADRCRHGSITKRGRSHARWLAVEAAQSTVRSSAPLAATYHRVRLKKGHNVAVVAVARKLVVLAWHMLRSGEPYRYHRPRTPGKSFGASYPMPSLCREEPSHRRSSRSTVKRDSSGLDHRPRARNARPPSIDAC